MEWYDIPYYFREYFRCSCLPKENKYGYEEDSSHWTDWFVVVIEGQKGPKNRPHFYGLKDASRVVRRRIDATSPISERESRRRKRESIIQNTTEILCRSWTLLKWQRIKLRIGLIRFGEVIRIIPYIFIIFLYLMVRVKGTLAPPW